MKSMEESPNVVRPNTSDFQYQACTYEDFTPDDGKQYMLILTLVRKEQDIVLSSDQSCAMVCND